MGLNHPVNYLNLDKNMKKKMQSFSDAFRETAFLDPEDPYKLSLVKAGHKNGHLVYDIDREEAQQWGQVSSQGKTALEAVLGELEIPYFAREVRQPLTDGAGEITLYGFFVAKNSAWKHKYETELDDGSDCHALGKFEGYPPCCVTEFCNEFPDYLEADMEYLDGVEVHIAENDVSEQETRLISILPALSHYPCSLTCTTALERGEEYLAFFEAQYPEAFTYYQNLADEHMQALAVEPE